MNTAYLTLVAFVAGAAIATQAALNARLGVLLDNPASATVVAFLAALVSTVIGTIVFRSSLPDARLVGQVPLHLWITGGVMSAVGVGLYYWLIPKLGVGQVIVYGLGGQLLMATTASHFGWFHLPVSRINSVQALGLACLAIGILLVQRSSA